MHTAQHMAAAMTDVATILDSLAIPLWSLRYDQITSDRGSVIAHVKGGGALIDQLASILDLDEPQIHPRVGVYRRQGHLGGTAVELFCGVVMVTDQPAPAASAACSCGGYCEHAPLAS